jgi:hypothetical protein
VARQVDPVTARRGGFIATFKEKDKGQMATFIKTAELTIKRQGMSDRREVVYTRVTTSSRGNRKFYTWQVFIIDKK